MLSFLTTAHAIYLILEVLFNFWKSLKMMWSVEKAFPLLRMDYDLIFLDRIHLLFMYREMGSGVTTHLSSLTSCSWRSTRRGSLSCLFKGLSNENSLKDSGSYVRMYWTTFPEIHVHRVRERSESLCTWRMMAVEYTLEEEPLQRYNLAAPYL